MMTQPHAVPAPAPNPQTGVSSDNVNDATLPEVKDSPTTGTPPLGQKPPGMAEHDTDNLNVPSIKHPSHQQWGKISGGWHQYR